MQPTIDYLTHPRRSPRVPLRCQAGLISAQGAVAAETEDLGAYGCRVVAPHLVRRGESLRLELHHPSAAGPLRVGGRVAWTSERAPWRLGVAFDEVAHEASSRWFHELLAAVPGLSLCCRVPDRIPLDAIAYLAAPPRLLVDVAPEEARLLRAIGRGVSIAELRAKLGDRWPASRHVFFSLLAHRRVTLSRGASVHPDAWREVFRKLDEACPGAAPGTASPPRTFGRGSPAPTHAPMTLPMLDPCAWGRP